MVQFSESRSIVYSRKSTFSNSFQVLSSSTTSTTILHHLEQQNDPKLVESTNIVWVVSYWMWRIRMLAGNGTALVDLTDTDGNYIGAYRLVRPLRMLIFSTLFCQTSTVLSCLRLSRFRTSLGEIDWKRKSFEIIVEAHAGGDQVSRGHGSNRAYLRTDQIGDDRDVDDGIFIPVRNESAKQCWESSELSLSASMSSGC